MFKALNNKNVSESYEKSLIKILFLIFTLHIFSMASDVNIDKAILQAKQENKQILIFFHMKYCGYCTKMVKENFKDKNILAQIKKNFIMLDIHIDHDDTVTFGDFKGTKKEFAKEINVNTYPATLFMDKYKKIVYRANGYKNIDEFMVLLKFISSQSYKKIDLETFTEENEFDDE